MSNSIREMTSGQWINLFDVKYDLREISNEGHTFLVISCSDFGYELISAETFQKHFYSPGENCLGKYRLSKEHNIQKIDLNDVFTTLGNQKVQAVFKASLFVALNASEEEKALEILSSKNINPNSCDSRGEAILHTAARKGFVKVVRSLFEMRVNVNAAGYRGDTPLIRAIKRNRIDIVQLLLNHPEIELNKSNENGETPFYIAALRGCESMLKELLDYRPPEGTNLPLIDVNVSGDRGSAFSILLKNKFFLLAYYILEIRADVEISDSDYHQITKKLPVEFDHDYCNLALALLNRDNIPNEVNFKRLLNYVVKYSNKVIAYQIIVRILELINLGKINISFS